MVWIISRIFGTRVHIISTYIRFGSNSTIIGNSRVRCILSRSSLQPFGKEGNIKHGHHRKL